jgi:hypothetical protein
MFKQQLEQQFVWQRALLIALWILIVVGAVLGLSLSIKFDIDQNNSYTSHKL